MQNSLTVSMRIMEKRSRPVREHWTASNHNAALLRGYIMATSFYNTERPKPSQREETKCEETKRRLLGILDYDGIELEKRVRHLMQQCGISRYRAKRALDGSMPRYAGPMLDIAKGLDVSIHWLVWGEILQVHPRTFRIHASVLGYPKHEIDQMARLSMALVAGQTKARNLADLIAAGKLSYPAAARLF